MVIRVAHPISGFRMDHNTNSTFYGLGLREITKDFMRWRKEIVCHNVNANKEFYFFLQIRL